MLLAPSSRVDLIRFGESKQHIPTFTTFDKCSVAEERPKSPHLKEYNLVNLLVMEGRMLLYDYSLELICARAARA